MLIFARVFFVILLGAAVATAQDSAKATGTPGGAARNDNGASQAAPGLASNLGATDPTYRLNNGDTVYITIGTRSNPSETAVARTIAKRGDIRLPWLLEDEVQLEGKTVREAERFLEKLYKDRKMLKNPVVSVTVSSYFLREVYIGGEVRSPGALPFPPDTVSLDIAEVIAKVGGFTALARADKVQVTHKDPNGKETVDEIDLESINSSKRRGGKARGEVPIYPGDRIFVPQRIF
jgi:protein involved in polysaccharide export with SLBB domain